MSIQKKEKRKENHRQREAYHFILFKNRFVVFLKIIPRSIFQEKGSFP